jgi:hypothetical protein
MTKVNWVREEQIGSSTWQWVGSRNGTQVFLTSGVLIEGHWTHLPAVNLECEEGEEPEDRFHRFVDGFLASAKERLEQVQR